MTEGDPSWAGALAGTALGLPVFHVVEDEIKGQVDEDLYEKAIGITEMVLEVDAIAKAVKAVRERTGVPT